MADTALKRLADMRKPGAWFIAAIEGVQESNGPGRTDPGWFHPSSLGHPCDAFLAFQYLGVQSYESINARLRRIFDNGSGRDEYLKRDIRRAGISLVKKEADRKVQLDLYYIRGELDDWIQHPSTGEQFVVDIKTMNHDEFTKLDAAKLGHVIQIHPYMFAKSTPNGMILYEDKNNQDLKIMPANFDHNLWTAMLERLERILTGIQNGYVIRSPIPNDSGCQFFHICSNANIPKMREEFEARKNRSK